MERRPTTKGGARNNNRSAVTLLWIAGLAVLDYRNCSYFEQTAIPFSLLATLGVTALPIVVANLSDLSGGPKEARPSLTRR